METRPPNKSFWMVPFSIHAARGLLRHERSRRKTMAIALLFSVALLVAGLTVLRAWLNPHEHPWRFILFWFACAWDTLLVLLLALLDLLLIRKQARDAKKSFREQFSPRTNSDEPGTPEEK
jgi:hypothetical protein